MLHVKNREFFFNHTSKDETKYDQPRRSIYLPVVRNNLYDGFSLFDCTDAAVSSSNRSTSTVASQALFMMNSDLLMDASKSLANLLLADAPEDDRGRVDWLFRRALGRPVTSPELDLILTSRQEFERELNAAPANKRRDESGVDESVSNHSAKLPADIAAWAAVCHSVLSSNEFIYVQ